ncbi:hypothetical protein [Actinoplanes solisilvae]|uniref:hypothetical protein n=1 Tax=Actinoplanes solisilvae TaxID=2486853 RepID=UPI000FD7B241|nr:hypothetical protein [Actinoplanes solisilvae]
MSDAGQDWLDAPRRVWRPTRPEPSAPSEPERPLMCGGDTDRALSPDEEFELMRQREREMREAERLEAEETDEPDDKPEPKRDDEDEQRVLERFRNDKYAVKLLKQDTDVWGGGSGDSGALG